MENGTKKTPKKAKVDKNSVSVLHLAHQPITTPPIHRAPKHKNLKFLLCLSILLGVLAGSAGIFFTSAHKSLAQIYLGSVPVRADYSDSQLSKIVDTASKNYRLSLKYSDGSQKTYVLGEVGVNFDKAATLKRFNSQVTKQTYRRLQWWQPLKIPLSVSINQTTFRAFIDGPATQAKVAASDANLSISNGVSVITPEKAGSGDSVKDAPKVIPLYVANMDTQPIKLTAGAVEPAIKATDLKSSKTKLDSILAQKVVLNIDSKAVTATPAEVGNWVDLSPIKSAKTVDVTVNSGKILKYIDQIARPYVQPPRARLVINTADGQQVLDPGKDGIDVINKDQAATTIAQAVTSGKGINTDLDVKYAAAKTVQAQTYDKWIVVDVTTKRMYAYEQTNIVKSFLVSAGAPKTPTVLGQYAIYSKFTSQDMRGFNADGSRYFQPAVPYINYFYKDYAIHGNYWRPASYFGNINSSHGCVGVPVGEGEWIYNWAPIGTPVIVHD